jgi:hypothetical protein
VTRTQIQLPDELYRRLKSYSKQREWTLAETLRRGAEHLMDIYPSNPAATSTWQPPKARALGWKNLTDAQIKQAIYDDMEPRL